MRGNFTIKLRMRVSKMAYLQQSLVIMQPIRVLLELYGLTPAIAFRVGVAALGEPFNISL